MRDGLLNADHIVKRTHAPAYRVGYGDRSGGGWGDIGGGAEVSSEFTITQTIGNSAMLYMTLYAMQQ